MTTDFTFYDFIIAEGWEDASISQISSDWSPRRYWRLEKNGNTALLMHSVDPDFRGHRLQDFIRLNAVYKAAELNVPDIYASDLGAGLLLLEDFGNISLDTPSIERIGYETAVDALRVLHDIPADGLIAFNDGYIFEKLWLYNESDAWKEAWQNVWDALPACPHVFSHMDYKAGNLHWLDGQSGLQRLGILDYQTAQNAPFVYDIVNLLDDARRDVEPTLKADLKARFKASLPPDWQDMFDDWYVVMAAQFHFMILGQMRASGKGDTAIMQRLERYLRAELTHPALAPVQSLDLL